jgi:hypothetical protein
MFRWFYRQSKSFSSSSSDSPLSSVQPSADVPFSSADKPSSFAASSASSIQLIKDDSPHNRRSSGKIERLTGSAVTQRLKFTIDVYACHVSTIFSL